MPDLGQDIIIAIYFVWFALCIAVQFPGPARRAIVRWDRLVLVPQWRFFSRPTRTDYRLLRRLLRPGGSPAPWTEVDLGVNRSPVAFLWNPGLMRSSSLRQAMDWIRSASETRPREAVCSAHRYQAVLSVASKDVPLLDEADLQFSIVAYREHDPAFKPSAVFESDRHPVRGLSGSGRRGGRPYRE